MVKISKIVLGSLLGTILQLSQAMDVSTIDKQIRLFLKNEDFNGFVKFLDKNNIDIHKDSLRFPSIFCLVIQNAMHKLLVTYNPMNKNRLNFFEYLLQYSDNLNKPIFSSKNFVTGNTSTLNPLEYIIEEFIRFEKHSKDLALTMSDSLIRLIRLLLNYGAEIPNKLFTDISDKARTFSDKSNFYAQVQQMFEHHKKNIYQAQATIPTKELLFEAISYNKPYIVKLIAIKKPSLIDIDDIEFAKTMSPASVPILAKGFKLKQLMQRAAYHRVPHELYNIIERYVHHNT